MIAQLWTSLLLLVGVIGFGFPIAASLGDRLSLPVSSRAALVPLGGLTAIGLTTLIVGHLGGLGSWLPYALAVAALVAVVATRQISGQLVRDIVAGGRAQVVRSPILATATILGLGLAVVASLAPPGRTDEVEYHWPAPLAWAQAGMWNDSPYRHVDAFPFMEIIYTAAATQGSYVAAHLLHLSTLMALGLGAAGVARSLGMHGLVPVAAAAMAMPVVWDGSYAAYNDTAVGAFGIVAVAVAIGGRFTWPAVWASAALAAVATSIKPTAVTIFGVLALMLLLAMWMKRPGHPKKVTELLAKWALWASVGLATLGFWTVRMRVYTGNWVDPNVVAEPDAIALTMLPTATEQLLSPLLPFVSGIIGAVEPWGGRTALVIQIFLVPAIIYVLWRRGEVARVFTFTALPAWAHWVLLGLAIVRTRFHLLSWVLLVVAVRGVVEDAGNRYPRARIWLEAVWTGAVLLSLADVSFEMVRLIRDEVF